MRSFLILTDTGDARQWWEKNKKKGKNGNLALKWAVISKDS